MEMQAADQMDQKGMEELPPGRQYYEDVSLELAERFIQENMKSAVRSVIAIGYYLKTIRDRELFLEAGFRDIWEYAEDRYGFSRSTASRYMSRNDKFSVDGNSPVLAEKYREFSKAQLQEMLSLNDEQLELVSPGMTVREIREIRKPREIPYYDIPGQGTIAEYFGISDEGDGPDPPEAEPMPSGRSDTYTMAVADLLPGDHGNECIKTDTPQAARCINSSDLQENAAESQRDKLVATSQQKEGSNTPLSAYGTPARVYPPDSLIATAGCEGGHDCFSCAMECPIRREERYCREAPLGNPFPCETVQYGFSGFGDWCQFVNHDMAYHRAGDGEPDPCCKNCQEPCDYICSRAMMDLDQESEQAQEPEEEEEPKTEDPEESSPGVKEYDRKILLQMIESEEKTLETMQDYWLQDQPWTYAKHSMMLQAYKDLMAAQDARAAADVIEDPVQPELPILRNNDQRKEWLDTFRDWPVWFKVPEASEVYYRYDLPDGTSLVICEYHYWLEWLAKYGSDKSPELVGTREYLLTPGYHYLHDCSTNRTAMIEKLKEIQKKE